jgi:hypothetical protein
MANNNKDFKRDLKALLKQYNAVIQFTADGDTHGLYDDSIIVKVDGGVIMRTGDWCLTHTDIKG